MIDSISFLILIGLSWLFLVLITNNKWVRLNNPEIGLGYALYRTKRFNKLIDKVANISHRFWRFLFDIGLLVSIGFLILAVLIFTINLLKFIQILGITSGILPPLPSSINLPPSEAITTVDLVPAIPGVSISFNTLPFFIIAITIAAALHELAHGVAARAEKIKVKSTGMMAFLFFFGAFVEPDEKSLNNATPRQKLRVYSAGAFVNLLIVLILIILLIPPIFQGVLSVAYNTTPQGALITEICPSGIDICPADGNIFVNDVIIKAGYENGTEKIITSNQDFASFSRGTFAGENISLYFLGEEQPVILITAPRPDNESQGFIGVLSTDFLVTHSIFSFLPRQLPSWLFQLVFITLSLSLVLALLNLLPIPPLDGDKIMSALLQHFKPNNFEIYLKWVRIGTLVMFAGNFILTFIIRGWTPI